jgi:deoxyribonuclease-2
MKLSQALQLLFLISYLALASTKLACVDREGKQVPWFTLIKFPGKLTNGAPRYAYLDAHSEASYKVISGSLADTHNEALPRTIEAINALAAHHSNVYIYNDEPAGSDASTSNTAHAKGILAFDTDTQTGVYIMHSIPKFPTISNGKIDFTIPYTATNYGQNAYCISLDKELLGHVMNNIPLERPTGYHGTGLFTGIRSTSKDNFAISQFNLLNGDNQWFITKNPKFNGYLYEDIIIPYFKTPLAVQSWGRPYQASICSGYSSVNINTISFGGHDTWDHTSDHSKWAITTGSNGKRLACLCDMNRMESQTKRGGSCMCSDNTILYTALAKLVVHADNC